MICPADAMQMAQKGKIGDGESDDDAYATWSLLECPLCNRQCVEFYAAIWVDGPEAARMIGGLLVARAMERA